MGSREDRLSWAWRLGVAALVTVIPAIGRRSVRWFEASVGYIMRPCVQIRKRSRGKAPEAQIQKDL